MNKEMIRKNMLKQRLKIGMDEAACFSVEIADKLSELECVKDARCVMAFYTYKNEPNLLAFMHTCLNQGKCVALPYIVGEGEMIGVDYHADCVMKSNVYGVPEPVITNDSNMVDPDVVIVPGIAFDKTGNRVGFGGGYYDRFLDKTDAVKIGVCFDCQIIDQIETGAHDVPMDIVITQKRTIGVR